MKGAQRATGEAREATTYGALYGKHNPWVKWARVHAPSVLKWSPSMLWKSDPPDRHRCAWHRLQSCRCRDECAERSRNGT